eukprot:gene50741-10975_t
MPPRRLRDVCGRYAHGRDRPPCELRINRKGDDTSARLACYQLAEIRTVLHFPRGRYLYCPEDHQHWVDLDAPSPFTAAARRAEGCG